MSPVRGSDRRVRMLEELLPFLCECLDVFGAVRLCEFTHVDDNNKL